MRYPIAIFLVAFTLCAAAQRNDFQSWVGFGVDAEILKEIDIELSPELRFDNNASELKSLLFDLDVSYPLHKRLRVGSQFRAQNKYTNNDAPYFGQRYGLYATLNHKIKKLRLKYRFLYQWEYMGLNTREYGYLPSEEHRHKFSLAYYRKKWDLKPSASMEFYIQRKPVFMLGEQKYRISLGLDYELTKKLELGLGYKYQYEYFANNSWRINIVSVGLNYSFK